jgi:hypothetical protein
MKISTVVTVSAFLFLYGCVQKSESRPSTLSSSSVVGTNYSIFVPKDSANKMIQSYLNSINYTNNDTDLRALVIDMDQLTKYIDSAQTAGKPIRHIKLFFGHTLEYINAGHANQPCGYRSGNLTLIVAGYDSLNNYTYYMTNEVLEYCMPCPNSCPAGNAGNALLN